MAKAKSSKKKGVKKRKRSSSIKKETESINRMISSERHSETNKILIDNFVGLQKVMVNLSTKFDNLSIQISRLLELFEISARSLAKKDIDSGSESKDTKKILEKLDNISQQAGLIGKGLVLIHEMGSEEKSSKYDYKIGYEKSIGENSIKLESPQVAKPIQKPRPLVQPENQNTNLNSAPKTREIK